MKTSEHHLDRWLPMIVGLCLASFALGAPCRVLFEELFEGPLDSGWYWIRGDAEKRRVENGTLSLFLEPRGLFRDHNSGINFLLRKLRWECPSCWSRWICFIGRSASTRTRV